MVLDNLFPVFILLLLGRLLNHFNLTHPAFLQTSDRLIYYIFFPALLFWKIGGHPTPIVTEWRFCLVAVLTTVGTFLLSLGVIRIFNISAFQSGPFSQSCFRFNTYIGMAVIINALGEAGVKLFSVLIGIVIPIINVLSVGTLIWFAERSIGPTARRNYILKAIATNPLIIACLCGLSYAWLQIPLPVFVDNTLRLASLVTLPLALLSIGASLTFKTVKKYWAPATLAALVKLAVLPFVGWMLLSWFGVKGVPAQVAMIYFALPASTAIYVLSSQLAGDTDLAAAAIAVSTLLSIVPLSLVMLL